MGINTHTSSKLMNQLIVLSNHGKEVKVPNSWELLTSTQYLTLVNYLLRMDRGELSPAEVRIYFLCDLLGLDVHKIEEGLAMENLLAISEQLTFLFRIVYPEENKAILHLPLEEYIMCQRIDPHRLAYPYARELEQLDYRYTIDLCFCHQLLPEIFADKERYLGYKVSTDFKTLTCSLTALQYIEARSILDMGEEELPLLAAILYYPGEYSSEGAQRLAHKMAALPKATLQAISLNFQAVNNFIFQKTPFSLLTKFVSRKDAPINTDAADALYDLAKDGLGTTVQLEKMNLLTYLRILRKKTIEGVKALKASGMDVVKISNEVGLPLVIVKQII